LSRKPLLVQASAASVALLRLRLRGVVLAWLLSLPPARASSGRSPTLPARRSPLEAVVLLIVRRLVLAESIPVGHELGSTCCYGITVSVAGALPPPAVAVIVRGVDPVTALVVIVNYTADAPAGTVMDGATDAAAGLLDDRVTVTG
jgi:hypothetical protein